MATEAVVGPKLLMVSMGSIGRGKTRPGLSLGVDVASSLPKTGTPFPSAETSKVGAVEGTDKELFVLQIRGDSLRAVILLRLLKVRLEFIGLQVRPEVIGGESIR